MSTTELTTTLTAVHKHYPKVPVITGRVYGFPTRSSAVADGPRDALLILPTAAQL